MFSPTKRGKIDQDEESKLCKGSFCSPCSFSQTWHGKTCQGGKTKHHLFFKAFMSPCTSGFGPLSGYFLSILFTLEDLLSFRFVSLLLSVSASCLIFFVSFCVSPSCVSSFLCFFFSVSLLRVSLLSVTFFSFSALC